MTEEEAKTRAKIITKNIADDIGNLFRKHTTKEDRTLYIQGLTYEVLASFLFGHCLVLLRMVGMSQSEIDRYKKSMIDCAEYFAEQTEFQKMEVEP